MLRLLCKKCGQEKDASEFYKARKAKRGYDGHCKVCRNAYHKARREGPEGDAGRATKRAWRAKPENKAKANARTAAWREQNRDKISAYSHKYRQENKEQIQANRKSEWQQRYYEKNKETISEYHAKRYRENKEEFLERRRHYRESPEGKAVSKKYNREYRQTERGRLSHRSCQAKRSRAAKGGVAAKDLEILSAGCSSCYFCGDAVVTTNYHPKQKTLEHLTSLSKGGGHIIENLTFSCRACNLKKGSLTEIEFWEKLRGEA